ncbi:T9SS type A sorting domain-containing protein [Flavobacterium sp. MFBS3-15]|uniref:T9SS type A sorting domain-containing protein n=1 Tax=Flavobacterium sp. MFBS3-15 TaxID=2989816 RepID=UPI002236BB27|nr:T9SS type A sorting domain-containing protein [Flavobacterium sp. MFBS3-15]MCW4468559.1 T9SS type A sorting domain-containing protein [Flavobacterium sp. MFBS3-15]
MKNLIHLFALFIFYLPAFSQSAADVINASYFDYEKISDGQYIFSFQTFFNSGSPGNCFAVAYSEVTIENDTLHAALFYEVVGAFQLQGCDRIDQIVYNETIPDNVTTIKMSANVKTYDENEPDNYPESFSLIYDVFTHYFTLPLGIDENIGAKVVVYPNPAKDFLFFRGIDNVSEVLLCNSLGQQSKVEVIGNTIAVSHLPDGFYLLRFTDPEGKMITSEKILKQ